MNIQLQNNIEPMVVDASNEENDGQEEEPVVVHSATLDLDSLSSTYVGLGRIYRLMFVADHCPPLKEEALRLALNHVESTCNVTMYQKIQQKLSESSLLAQAAGGNLPDVAAAGPSASGAAVSLQWIEAKNKKAALKLEKLDSELKTSKVNSIKESVRRGHDELGDHYLDCGELSNALKCYTRARDYCTSHMHILEFCLNVVKVSIYLQNWSHVQSYVQKAHNTTTITENKTPTVAAKEQMNVVQTKLHCAAGLADLATKKYKSSARHFLRAQLDSCEFSCVLSPYNVALYGGLCALATFSRQELHKLLIMNSSFKQFLELEPQLRDVIFKFYESKYAQCLKILESMKDNLLLDMYLSPHVNTLYTRIRSRGLVQYFSPYKSATLHRMASAFNTTVPCLENELSVLILEGHMHARIDSHKKIVYAAVVEERLETFSKALEMGQENMDRLHTLILRAALMRNQLMVKPSSREGHSALGVVGGEAQVGQDNQSS